jgi:hypothetical protein
MARTCKLPGCGEDVTGRSRYCSDQHRYEARRESDRAYHSLHSEARNARRRQAASGELR